MVELIVCCGVLSKFNLQGKIRDAEKLYKFNSIISELEIARIFEKME